MRKGFHKTKDGRTARKGLYYYANKEKHQARNQSNVAKGYVTKAAVKRAAKTVYKR